MKNTQRTVALHQLVDHVVVSLIHRVVQQRSFIINDLKQEMLVTTDENILTTVLSSLLDTTISNTQNNCIRVSAKFFGNIILIYIKDNDDGHDTAIFECLHQVERVAEKLGGCVTLTNNKVKGTTVAFSFYNGQNPAKQNYVVPAKFIP